MRRGGRLWCNQGGAKGERNDERNGVRHGVRHGVRNDDTTDQATNPNDESKRRIQTTKTRNDEAKDDAARAYGRSNESNMFTISIKLLCSRQ